MQREGDSCSRLLTIAFVNLVVPLLPYKHITYLCNSPLHALFVVEAVKRLRKEKRGCEKRKMSVSRVYADVVTNLPPEYSDYESVDIKWQ